MRIYYKHLHILFEDIEIIVHIIGIDTTQKSVLKAWLYG